MLSPSVALLVSIAGILILIRLKVRPGLAIFAGSLTISLLLLPPQSLPGHMLHTLIDRQTLTLLAVVASALTLSRLMEVKGLLTSLASTMERLGPKLAMHAPCSCYDRTGSHARWSSSFSYRPQGFSGQNGPNARTGHIHKLLVQAHMGGFLAGVSSDHNNKRGTVCPAFFRNADTFAYDGFSHPARNHL